MNLDSRLIYVITILVIAIPYIIPISIPLKINEPTRDSFNTMEGIQDGSVVLLTVETGTSSLAEMESGITSIARYLSSRNFKLVIMSSVTEEGPIITQEFIEPILLQNNYQAGVDYVHLGYVPGKGIAYQTIAEDIRSVVSQDFNGESIDNLPLMADVNSAEDFDMLVTIDSSSGMMYSVSYFGTPFGTPIVGVASASCYILRYADYKGDLIQGIVGGLVGFAEFETLIKKPGLGLAGLGALTCSHLLLIFFIVLGNVEYLRSRSSGGVEK